MPLPAFLLPIDTAENRTLCRARALNKRGAFVASGRGRRQAAEAGAYLRSKYADSPRKLRLKTDAMFIESQLAMRRINGSPPAPRRIELCAGRERKENAASTQAGTRFPDGGPGGKRIPESKLGMGFIFPDGGLSGKYDPEFALRTGHAFPPTAPPSSTPKPARSPSQNWVEESQNAIAGGQYDCRR